MKMVVSFLSERLTWLLPIDGMLVKLAFLRFSVVATEKLQKAVPCGVM
jgi:hypothetical protein